MSDTGKKVAACSLINIKTGNTCDKKVKVNKKIRNGTVLQGH